VNAPALQKDSALQPSPEPNSALAFPPPREDWERPPSEAWTSSLRLWALRALELALAVGAGVGAVKLGLVLRAMAETPLEGGRLVGFCLLCLLALALSSAPFAWIGARIGGLELALELLTDQDRLARVRGRPPIWLDEEPTGDVLRVAHLSDPHLAEGEGIRIAEANRPAGNRAFAAVLDAPAIAKADLLLLTGDITDRGTAASWRAFFDLLDARGLADRTLLVPGNHDVAIIEALEPGHVVERAFSVDRFAFIQLANLYKFGLAFARTLGGKDGVVFRSPQLGLPKSLGPALPGDARGVVTFAEAWKAVEAQVGPFIEGLAAQPVPALRLASLPADWRALRAYRKRIETARNRLLALFPVAVPVPGRDAVVFVLNSNTMLSHHPAFSALGMVGRDQYRRLDALARSMPQRLRLAALHHHLVRRGEELASDLKQRVFGRMGLLGDWWRVVRFSREQGIRAVLNGHRHLAYELRLPNGSALLAAPSSTLGDELSADPRPQFALYTLPVVPVPDNTVNVFRAMVRLPSDEESVVMPAASGAGD
jgi:hypothetical protein